MPTNVDIIVLQPSLSICDFIFRCCVAQLLVHLAQLQVRQPYKLTDFGVKVRRSVSSRWNCWQEGKCGGAIKEITSNHREKNSKVNKQTLEITFSKYHFDFVRTVMEKQLVNVFLWL